MLTSSHQILACLTIACCIAEVVQGSLDPFLLKKIPAILVSEGFGLFDEDQTADGAPSRSVRWFLDVGSGPGGVLQVFGDALRKPNGTAWMVRTL